MKQLLFFFAILLALVGCNSRPECELLQAQFLKDSDSTAIRVYVDGAPYSGYMWDAHGLFLAVSKDDTLFKTVLRHDNGERAIVHYYPDETLVYFNVAKKEISEREFKALYPNLVKEFNIFEKKIKVKEY